MPATQTDLKEAVMTTGENAPDAEQFAASFDKAFQIRNAETMSAVDEKIAAAVSSTGSQPGTQPDGQTALVVAETVPLTSENPEKQAALNKWIEDYYRIKAMPDTKPTA